MQAHDLDLISPHEAAHRLGVARETLLGWVREGRIPCYRLGRKFRRLSWAQVLGALAPAKGVQRATPTEDVVPAPHTDPGS